MPEEDPIVE
jgi:GPN-loop GTPase